MISLIANPVIYVTWAVIVVAGLGVAYRTDPYIFAFAAIGLAWVTGAMSLIGLAAALLRRPAHPSARIMIVMALAVAVAAIAVAFGVLRTFKWA